MREQHAKGDASARGGEIRASLSWFRRSFARCLAARLIGYHKWRACQQAFRNSN